MTFDEALDQLEQLANFEVCKTTGNIRRDFKLELGDVRDILAELRQEYAPTVEMTKEQKEDFLFYKNTTWFSLFLGKLNDPDNKEFRSLPNLNSFKDWGFQKKRECELMQAWLHPEIIKVVDE